MRLGAVFSAVALLALAASPAMADGRDVYTVADVPVDATAANAHAARDQARADGEQRAYQMLLDRLTLAADRTHLPPPSQDTLDNLVAGFAVAGEHVSSVRYIAKY